MSNSQPILLVIYNRPESVKPTVDMIRSINPSALYVAADGPHYRKPGDKARCKQARDVVDSVNWKCGIYKNYSSSNLGLRRRMASAIDWFFSHEEQGIILEDDCVPDPSFFKFCGQLLDRFRDDERIMAVAGSNFQPKNTITDSYYFSKYAHCWGWATWRRAWRHYDDSMKLWPEIKESNAMDYIFDNPLEKKYWSAIFDGVSANRINSWAYRWQFACWQHSGLTILPGVNLVRNIGFGPQATHTKFQDKHVTQLARKIDFPLKHPMHTMRNVAADKITSSRRFLTPLVVAGLIKNILTSKISK